IAAQRRHHQGRHPDRRHDPRAHPRLAGSAPLQPRPPTRPPSHRNRAHRPRPLRPPPTPLILGDLRQIASARRMLYLAWIHGGPRMSEEIDRDRRRFLGSAVMTIAAAELGIFASADAQPAERKPAAAAMPNPERHLGPLKQIDAGVLNVGYAETGPA